MPVSAQSVSNQSVPEASVADHLAASLRQAVALALWHARAIRVADDQPFKLASGNFSPIYVNCRTVISNPNFMRLFAASAALLLADRELEADVLAGGETAGIPYAYALGSALSKPTIYIRKQAKRHGIAKRVEGRLDAGSRVLLVEDLITDGGSKVGFLEAIRAAGASVAEALVLFDRQQGGASLLERHGVRLTAVTDRATAFAVAGQHGLVDERTAASVDAYFADAESWHAERGLAFQRPD